MVIVSFSSKIGGNCEKTADTIEQIFGNKIGLTRFNFSGLEIQPCGRCHYECLRQKVCPWDSDAERTLLDAVCASDRAIFIVPNYCDHPCANFFIFNERSNGYFQGNPELLQRYLQIPKGFVIINGSENGIFRHAMMQHTEAEPKVLYLRTKDFGKSSVAGDLMDAPDAVAQLEAFAAALCEIPADQNQR